jgi:hypothetical protein
MSLIPGWDSVTGAHSWSNIYFWLSIIALLSLGVFEVVSHRYSERKDELAAIEQEATKKSHDKEIAQLHLDTATANAGAESARLETERLKAQFAWRALDAPTLAKLDAAARTHAPASVNLRFVDGDPEAQYFAIQIGNILAKAGWHIAPGATKLGNVVLFGIWLPEQPGDGLKLKAVLSAAGLPFDKNPIPGGGAGLEFNTSSIPGANAYDRFQGAPSDLNKSVNSGIIA